MGLQRGNVETNPGPAPEPWMTVEEFRKKFTDKHRKALCELILAEEKRKTEFQVSLGISKESAAWIAHGEMEIYREILQCIAGIHPEPYTW